MTSKIIIGGIFLILTVILWILGTCTIDLWILIAAVVAVFGVLSLQYRKK